MSGVPTSLVSGSPPTTADVARTPSDTELMIRFVTQKDPVAFANLVDRHGGTVWNICRRILDRQEDVGLALALGTPRSGRTANRLPSLPPEVTRATGTHR
jgi:hypothetical protein